MGRFFRNVADHSGAQLNAAPVDAQPPVTFDNVADNIFVIVVYLLMVRVSLETKGDETAGELLRLETALMTDLGIEFGQTLERVLELDDFHFSMGLALMRWQPVERFERLERFEPIAPRFKPFKQFQTFKSFP
ncbi:MAG TPA: hypothetical protein VI585_10440 [Candidatus Binatia bacterium]